MLPLICCKSNPKKESTETINVYFPSFPSPGKETIIPIDVNGKVVKDSTTEIVNVVIPYWYWIMITNYVTETEEAVQALTIK